MSLSSVMTFGMMPTDEDFSECTGMGEWEKEWDQQVQAMETKKATRRQRGMGSVMNQEGVQPGFQTMERSLQTRVHAATQTGQQAQAEQDRVAVETTDAQGRKAVKYVTKEEAAAMDEASVDLGADESVVQAAAERAAAYAAAMTPKYTGAAADTDSVETQMGR